MSQRKWQKSSFSEGGADTCAEVGDEDGIPRIRESDEPGRVVATSRAALGALLAGVKADDFGGPGE
ncbi:MULTISPECIES: DUF397 domain-containing protein [unclassified Streptomyces]|uniref:DUF397 domain-containing protein n=1 Tax=unclassified Streptomyces TaxID=2593676 RepID=UPI000BF5C883|nr:DUF397 domain-containing protein [Streptomyces sp. Ru87]PGH48404.1 DUF397 domain-containing protein [Streptomyces sp. Ru87]